MIIVENISKSYGNRKVIHELSFSLDKGVTAFLGNNGAGKTTTLNILAGVLSQDVGKVMVDGIDLLKEPEKAKRMMGYLPENNPLYEDMYVQEYLRYAARIYLSKREINKRVEEMIETLDLKNEYKKKIRSLSHGNRQRVGLAQALIHDPDILILDEPNNGLDPIQQKKINELIAILGRSKTILFSTHRLDDVSEVANHYLIINEGKLLLNEKAENVGSIKESFYSLTQ